MASKWSRLHTAGLLLSTILIFVLCYFVPITNRLYLWWGVMVLLTATAVIIGQGITGQLTGILIDSRNKMSLSRLQLAMWTVLIVSAFVVFFFWRLKAPGKLDPLGFSVPSEVWALLGISSASLAGSSLIKTNKKNQTPNVPEESETVRKMAAQGQTVNDQLVTGRAVLNDMPQAASWADLFRGEESGNASTVSIGKFQMFYFTIVAVFTYGYALAAMFGRDVPGEAFPAVSSGLLGLLGISHAGYLADKAVPHTQDPAPGSQTASGGTVASTAPASGAPIPTPTAPVTTVSRTARRMGQMS